MPDVNAESDVGAVAASSSAPVSALIDEKIAALGDWRGPVLARMRGLIHEALPQVVEELKWRGTPVWSCGGMLCTGETWKAVVKLTFAHGAALPDPAGLFNASLEGGVRRAIDIREGQEVPAEPFKALMRAAAAHHEAVKVAKVAKAGTAVKAGATAGTTAGGGARAARPARARKTAGGSAE